jgi:hypothetical protein
MEKLNYSTATWSQNELHPSEKSKSTLDWIFTIDLLNFSFWSGESSEERYKVLYKGKLYSGYWSLCAAINRALDEGIPITSAKYWTEDLTLEKCKYIFRSETREAIPMLAERFENLKETGSILMAQYNGDFENCLHGAEKSAQKLLGILVDRFPSFRDFAIFNGKPMVRQLIYRRNHLPAEKSSNSNRRYMGLL